MGWVVNARPWPLYFRERDPESIVKEAEWAPGTFWTGAENLTPTEIRSLDRPARSSVAVPTELSQPVRKVGNSFNFTKHKNHTTLWHVTPYSLVDKYATYMTSYF